MSTKILKTLPSQLFLSNFDKISKHIKPEKLKNLWLYKSYFFNSEGDMR